MTNNQRPLTLRKSATAQHSRAETYAAVLPKISALLAFVSRPTTAAKRHVKSTIIPTLTLVPWSATAVRQTMAPMRRRALRETAMTAPVRWTRRSGK